MMINRSFCKYFW